MPSALFSPFTLKSATLRNRIAVAPMCQYMATDGLANHWHLAHYASLARGGAALVVVEATAASPEGRITHADLGLWNDAQAEALVPIAAAIKAAGAVPGIQIAHAGRKASANRPWEGDDHIPLGQPNSWETIAPSPVPFGANLNRTPREMSLADIARVQDAMAQTAARAHQAGFEWLQLHFAHGYLAQNFFSPLSNLRTDAYGGSPENRARYLLETFHKVRAVWPDSKPLAARLGVVDFHNRDSEMLAESIALLKAMKQGGLDFADISMGFNTPEARIPWAKNLLLDTARQVLDAVNLPGATSWNLATDPAEANALLEARLYDLHTLARPLLAEPHWPYLAAKALNLDNPAWATLPPPYAHWLARYR